MSETTEFWDLYDELPEDVKNQADSTNQLWQINPHAQGLYFKRAGKKLPVYSVRIGSSYRRLAYLKRMLFYGFGLALMTNMNTLLC